MAIPCQIGFGFGARFAYCKLCQAPLSRRALPLLGLLHEALAKSSANAQLMMALN